MPDPKLLFGYCCARLGIDPHDERGMTTTEVAVIVRGNVLRGSPSRYRIAPVLAHQTSTVNANGRPYSSTAQSPVRRPFTTPGPRAPARAARWA